MAITFPALSLCLVPSIDLGAKIKHAVAKYPLVKAKAAIFVNLNQVEEKSQSGSTLGSSLAIMIKVTQKINLKGTKIQRAILFSIKTAGVFRPKKSNTLKTKNIKVTK